MGLGAAGGIRAGIAPYTDAGDVDRLVDAVRSTLDAGSASRGVG
jgi:selenocysteine lyase/cysteine desulfurase